MKKIGLLDYFIDEWHSNTYLSLFVRAAKSLSLDFEVAYAWAEMDRFENRRSTDEWCKENGIEKCETLEELIGLYADFSSCQSRKASSLCKNRPSLRKTYLYR